MAGALGAGVDCLYLPGGDIEASIAAVDEVQMLPTQGPADDAGHQGVVGDVDPIKVVDGRHVREELIYPRHGLAGS